MTEQEYWQAQFLEVGQLVQYKGQEATIRLTSRNSDRIAHDWARILIKATGEARYVRIEDLLIESEKK